MFGKIKPSKTSCWVYKGVRVVELNELFVASKDTETHRICGTCGVSRPLDEFYKDGKDSYGKTRYRRDCRDCYKKTRIQESKMKGGKKK